MELEGKIWKEGKFWLVEIPSLDAMTQGKTRKEALFMVKDLVTQMIRMYFKEERRRFKVIITDSKKDAISITTDEPSLLFNLHKLRLCTGEAKK